MRGVTSSVTEERGRYAIIALGGLYLVVALGRTLVKTVGGAPVGDALIQLLLVGVPGGILLYGGYRLRETEIHPDLYPRIADWCLAGLGVMLALLLLYDLQPGGGMTSPADSIPILTALATVAGFGIGHNDAKARTRARIAEERSRELEQYSHELERQNERLESFAGMLAHELRNPLDIAQIYHQQERPRNESAAEEVDIALERIEEMIDILLVTVRGSQANIGYEPVRLSELASNAWADVVADAERAELVVETEHTILGNPVHVRHLLVNLFRNSIEHSDDPVTVRIGDLETGFYVADDGPGIPENVRNMVAGAGFSTKPDGTGLGLTYAAQLAETYEWDWTLTTEPTGGTRLEFTNVDLPSADETVNHH